MSDLPKTLIEAVRYFSDPARCNEVMADLKWPDGEIVCPKCGGKSVTPVKGRPQLQCNVRTCKKQFSYKIDTIFEDSPLGLDKWFVDMKPPGRLAWLQWEPREQKDVDDSLASALAIGM
jgi:hypothetical protein